MTATTAWRPGQATVVTDGDVLIVAAGLAAGMAVGWRAGAVVTLVAALVTRRRPAVIAVALAAGVVGMFAWQRSWTEVQAVTVGPFKGFVTVAGDPVPLGHGVRVTIEITDQRFDALVFGRTATRVGGLSVGERVWIEGTRRRLGPSAAKWARMRHVVGAVQVRSWGDVRAGAPLYVSATRLRATVRRVADGAMGPVDGALFSGLVLGDDSREPPEMVERFRDSGLSHLTAVSGQNITLLVALLGPMLRRLRPGPRLVATLGAICWLVVVTRFEPSVLRAGVMAGIAAVAFARGRPSAPLRLLALSVTVILLLDPLLVRSVGLWLSVGATAGVIVIAPLINTVLVGPGWIRRALSITLGAQLGVAVPSLLVFARLPVVAPLTNLAAVPVAALVMTVGIPCALLAALWQPLAAVSMAVPATGTRWVRHVAELGAAVEPPPAVGLTVWGAATIILAVAIVYRHRRGSVAT